MSKDFERLKQELRDDAEHFRRTFNQPEKREYEYGDGSGQRGRMIKVGRTIDGEEAARAGLLRWDMVAGMDWGSEKSTAVVTHLDHAGRVVSFDYLPTDAKSGNVLYKLPSSRWRRLWRALVWYLKAPLRWMRRLLWR